MTPGVGPAGAISGSLLVRVLYGVAVVGGLLATGMIVPGVALDRIEESAAAARPFVIPAAIYLYAHLGAMAYVVIRFVDDWRPDARTVVGVLLRIPAALLVVVGVYLLGTLVELGELVGVVLPMLSSEGRYETAFTAFLVGLFVDRALSALAIVSARLYPGNPNDLRPVERSGAEHR